MGDVMAIDSVGSSARAWRTWSGLTLLVAGLIGHLLAAHAIGGTFVAYRDHVLGFVLLTIVSGALLALFGRRFWRGRHEVTLLWLGVVQAVIGVLVYIERFSVHG
jgi:hypothetical protein